jgi:hypothetical protein
VSTKTKLTECERVVLAAYFARSNMGMDRATSKEVQGLLAGDGHGRYPVTLDSAVMFLCQQFMESDEHYDFFMEEAKMWASRRYFGGKYRTRDAVIGTWPHVKEVFWPEEENT